jgi:hypothetical protein
MANQFCRLLNKFGHWNNMFGSYRIILQFNDEDYDERKMFISKDMWVARLTTVWFRPSSILILRWQVNTGHTKHNHDINLYWLFNWQKRTGKYSIELNFKNHSQTYTNHRPVQGWDLKLTDKKMCKITNLFYVILCVGTDEGLKRKSRDILPTYSANL